ncbi:MAG: glycosyltransferase family 2 protein [Spirosomataceae bacterium]
MNDKALTIITVTYNAGELLANTLESVRKGWSPGLNVEYLLIDGNSTDQTLEIAAQFSSDLLLKIISEPDEGLYDAMNKGIGLAKGKYLWFLNAGDEMHDDTTLPRLLASLKTGADVYYSDALFVSSEGKPLGLRSQVTPHRLPKQISWQDMAMGMKICHQAFIVKKSLAPLFEIDNLSADLEWEIVALKNANTVEYLDFTLCKYLLGGLSTQRHRKSLSDRWRVLQRHFGFWRTLINHFKIALRGALFYIRKGRYW